MEKNKAEVRRIETVALNTLVMDGENARLHNRRNLDAIKQSIQKFGQYRPFVVNRRDRRIAVGNGMLLAMRELGFSEGAVLFLDLSPEEFRRLSIADNRSGDLSANDPALLLGRLKSLPEELLSLSGFLSADLDILREESRSGRELEKEDFVRREEADGESTRFVIGDVSFALSGAEYLDWKERNGFDRMEKEEVLHRLRELLGVEEEDE